jgi:hypothetical protein
MSGLDPDQLYRWRLRVLTDSPFAPRSRWFSIPYNAVTEADLRTDVDPTAVADMPAPGRLRWFAPAAPNPFNVYFLRLGFAGKTETQKLVLVP